MEKFAGYGFNKSHAAAYALVAYQTAYMKAHHPAAFMAANLSAVMDDTDKVHQLLRGRGRQRPHGPAARHQRLGVPLRAGRARRRSATDWARSRAPANRPSRRSSRRARQGGPFRDLFDFCRRVDKRIVNRRVLEALIRAGAFDSIDDHRASLLASAGIAIEGAEQASRAAAQNSLFGGDAEARRGRPRARSHAPRWSEQAAAASRKSRRSAST